jgi:hypothetical protein
MNGLEKEVLVPKSWRLRSGQALLCLAKISKGQFASGRLWLKDQAAPAIWNAMLAA